MIRDLWLRVVLRPLGRLIGTDRWEPWLAFRGRCLACGDEAVCLIPADTTCLARDSGHIWGVQCGGCGERAVASA